MYSLRLLGGVLLEGPSGPASGRAAQRRQLALLALLACARDKGLTRDKLIGYLWPETDGERARRHLSDALYVLRRSLGEEAVVAAGESLRLDPESVRCDVCAFEEALERDDPAAAVALYDGPLLDGFYLGDGREFEGWVEAERARLADRYAGAVEALAERAEEAGAYRDAAEWWKRLAAHDPYNSRAMVRLVEALAAAGDPANALELARVHEVRLREELGIEPPADLAAAIERLKREPVASQPGGRVEGAAPVPTEPPTQVHAVEEAAPIAAGWTFRRLVSEIHRRTLWQVLLIYAGTSWVVFAAVQTLTEGLGLPGWFPAFALVILLVGLPFVLATAFVQEGPPLVSRSARRGPANGSVAREGDTAEGIARVLSWRNAVLAGVVAFALLGVGTAAYMAMRVMGVGPMGSLLAKGVVEPRERIVLAEFENHTSDSTLAFAVTDLFRTALSQSRALWLAEGDYIAQVRQRMEMELDVPLTYDAAREVAIREGLKAVIAGAISSAGTGYVISARLVAAESGETQVAHSESARDSTEIIRATGQLSNWMRERIGESLKTIRKGEPLEDVTTSSLEALRSFSLARRAHDRSTSISLYEEAIEIDTAFAAAYMWLGVAFYNSEERHRARELFGKAYQYRRRLPEKERNLLLGVYHQVVTGDIDKTIAAYERVVEVSDSSSNPALLSLGHVYKNLFHYQVAERLYRRVIENDSSRAVFAYMNLIWVQVSQGAFDDAEITLERWRAHDPRSWRRQNYRASELAALRGDYQEADRILRESALRADTAAGFSPAERIREQSSISYEQAELASYRGKLAEAERHLRIAVQGFAQSDLLGRSIRTAFDLATLDAWFRGSDGRGTQVVEELLARHPLDAFEPPDRPYLRLAVFYWIARRLDDARAVLSEYERLVDPELRGRGGEHQRRYVRGALALAEGKLDDAVRELRLARQYGCGYCELPLIGRAYELAGEPDSALTYYEEYASTPSILRYEFLPDGKLRDQYWLALIYERLGELYEQRGNTEKAIYYYGKLVELWKDADPELQPRVDAARRAIEALSTDR